MKYEPVTIKDIAKALQLSASTVSRALRDSYEISATTKQQVIDYARKYNYQPNPVALSMKNKRTRSIGVIVPEIANSFFSQVINGIESVAQQYGYHVIITQNLEKYEREAGNVEFLASRSVDGCLVSVSAETTDFTHFTKLNDKGFAMVFFDRVPEEIQSHRITADNITGAYKATQHLISNNCRRIAFIGAAADLFITRQRFCGYKKAMEENNMLPDERLVQHCMHGGTIPEEVEHSLSQLFLHQLYKPDAVLTATDKLTIGALRFFKKHKIRVPCDAAVAGFSNSEITDLLPVSVTIVQQPAFDIGKESAELLIKIIESKKPPEDFIHESLPVKIIKTNF